MKEVSIKIFKYILLVLFMTYTAIYFMVDMGYYEYSTYKRKTLTEKQIKKFEEDVKAGVEIDIENYYVEEENFNNKPKQVGLIISEKICAYVSSGIRKIFSFLNKSMN